MKNLVFLLFFSALARGKFFKAPDKTDPAGSNYQVTSSFAQEEETSQHQCSVSGYFLFYFQQRGICFVQIDIERSKWLARYLNGTGFIWLKAIVILLFRNKPISVYTTHFCIFWQHCLFYIYKLLPVWNGRKCSLYCFLSQASLNKLMETLGQAEPYFVKCIRSNAEKVKMFCKLELLSLLQTKL